MSHRRLLRGDWAVRAQGRGGAKAGQAGRPGAPVWVLQLLPGILQGTGKIIQVQSADEKWTRVADMMAMTDVAPAGVGICSSGKAWGARLDQARHFCAVLHAARKDGWAVQAAAGRDDPRG